MKVSKEGISPSQLLAVLQVAAAQKEIHDSLSDKALEFLRDRKKAKPKSILSESSSTDSRHSVLANRGKDDGTRQMQAQSEAGHSLKQPASGGLWHEGCT